MAVFYCLYTHCALANFSLFCHCNFATVLCSSCIEILNLSHILWLSDAVCVFNPRCACAARVTVVALCVCVCVCLCVQAAHLRLTQLSDKLDILTDLVSCWLQNEFGVFRIIASFRR